MPWNTCSAGHCPSVLAAIETAREERADNPRIPWGPSSHPPCRRNSGGIFPHTGREDSPGRRYVPRTFREGRMTLTPFRIIAAVIALLGGAASYQQLMSSHDDKVRADDEMRHHLLIV